MFVVKGKEITKLKCKDTVTNFYSKTYLKIRISNTRQFFHFYIVMEFVNTGLGLQKEQPEREHTGFGKQNGKEEKIRL